jgi:putative transposase
MLPKHAGWGGHRKGAGRKASGSRQGASHSTRPNLSHRFPVHVTLRVLPHVWNLRSRRGLRIVYRALAQGSDRLGMRLCEFSVQGNHVHIIAEADDTPSLSRGMQGLVIRLAKGLNGMMRRAGRVMADRFHAHILRTLTEVRRAFHYVQQNRVLHRARWAKRESISGGTNQATLDQSQLARLDYVDPCSSAAPNHGVPLPRPRTYLLSRAQAEAPEQPPPKHYP